MRKLFILLIDVYSTFVSPFLVNVFGHACRYHPTCSQYSKEAINKYGVVKGGQLAIKRLSSCHPYSTRDHFDPLPKIGRSQRVKPEGQASLASA